MKENNDKKVNPINDRIRELIEEQKITHSDFCKKINVPGPTLKTSFNRKATPGIDIIIKIAKAYPQYSLDWLLLGQGDKLKQSYIIRVPTDADEGSVNESSFVYGAPENNKAEDIQRLEREVASLIESCHTLVKTNSQLVDMNIKLQSNPK